MNGTPRRGPGGFPSTPQTRGTPSARSTSTTATTPRPNVRSPLPDVPTAAAPPTSTSPVIPAHVLDPATQRAYVFAAYLCMWAYRSYDFYTLALDDDSSLWLCLKWCFLDMSFMFGLPLLYIPWLEWSNMAAFVLFVLHAAVDVMLMFRIGIPVQSWLFSLVAFMWDKELAISERSVKPGAIIHNASLILGKQIINILPEGSAILNPNKDAFCLNSSVTQLDIPVLINQTEPIELEFLRIDLQTSQNETVVVKNRDLKNMLKKARKGLRTADPADPLTIHFTAKKPGVYMLRKVLDQSKLQVRPRSSNAVVATCPQARVRPTGQNRCRNDLSDITLEVEGVPPLRLKYRANIGGHARGASELQGLQPNGYISPLSRHTSQVLIHGSREDVSWAQSQIVAVPLNETLTESGVWSYAVEEVADGLGNIVNFIGTDEEDRPKPKATSVQGFRVHERPNAALACDIHSPMKVPKGEVARLPVTYGSTGRQAIDSPHTIEYMFTPEADLSSDGDHSANAELKKQTMKVSREKPQITAKGLYTLKSVTTEFCSGEVLEPTSCLLQNPPEPEVSLESEDIVDKCAGNPIGLRVALDLIGTPPFQIRYKEHKAGRKRPDDKVIVVQSLRSTIELTPERAGHYTYTFETIRDHVYQERQLHGLQLVQDVRPSASAHFVEAARPKQACIDDQVEFDVALVGDGPWMLEYELVHNGKRTKHSQNIEQEHFTIQTKKLTSGGEYTLALTSVTDKMQCKEFLNHEEAKVQVRHERPKAYFGHIDGKQAVMALEGKPIDLPLRLTGSRPWRLEYENLDTKERTKKSINDANSNLHIKQAGTYQLLTVQDSVCPGLIDDKASQFSVGWVPRPRLSIPESVSMVQEGAKYIREDVCEGDEDAFDVSLTGNAPFDLSYEQQFKDLKSGRTVNTRKKDLRALGGSASIRAESSQAGSYEYKFVQLADSKYDHSPKHFAPMIVQQKVNPRPSARFNSPGKTYSYCSREADGEEVIPMTLEGVAPFYLEVEIKHHGTPKPEISIHKNIASTKYDLRIEHRKLHLGHSSVSIRKIRDARGCTQKPAPGGPRVQISVHDAPTATPMEDRTDFCVGERLSFALSGQVPFTVYYTFEKQERKASNAGTTFRRLAESPGVFTITGLRDSESECLASLSLTKEIHPIPSVQLSGGQVSEVDIHEGGGTDLEFEFWGTPPFEFTYTRSTNAHKGRKSKVLEIRTEVSHGHHLSIPVQEEGTYEVVSIKDRWCSFARQVEGVEMPSKGQKLLTY